MIKTPTVLVLGAGASMPYGFPSGNDLKNIILDNLLKNHSSGWYDFLASQNVTEGFARNFGDLLRRSGSQSIDLFLSTHADFIPCGKICIALALIPLEEENRIYESELNCRDKWYEYLWSKIHEPKQSSFLNNNLSIITFNYDRSFDYFLYNAIKSCYFDRSLDSGNYAEIESLFKSINILHIHGQLGHLPGLGNNSRNYIPNLTEEAIQIAWRQIRVISEHNYQSETYRQAYQRLQKAERIYFLGFGYNENNLETLTFDQINEKFKYGTSVGLGDSDCEAIRNKWHINLPEPRYKILEFLKNHATLD
jgi:hypothetical protein